MAFAAAHLNVDVLWKQADLVVLSEVISVDQGLDTTKAQVRVLQVFKGAEKPGTFLSIQNPGGKVIINEDQPAWSTLQTDLLFLQKEASGGYICVNQADGQKTVRGRNIYPFHDNMAYSVPLKDYLEALDAAIKAPRQ